MITEIQEVFKIIMGRIKTFKKIEKKEIKQGKDRAGKYGKMKLKLTCSRILKCIIIAGCWNLSVSWSETSSGSLR